MNQEQHHDRAYWIKWGIALLIPVVTYFWTGTTPRRALYRQRSENRVKHRQHRRRV